MGSQSGQGAGAAACARSVCRLLVYIAEVTGEWIDVRLTELLLLVELSADNGYLVFQLGLQLLPFLRVCDLLFLLFVELDLQLAWRVLRVSP